VQGGIEAKGYIGSHDVIVNGFGDSHQGNALPVKFQGDTQASVSPDYYQVELIDYGAVDV
jgi:hypothetical protein